MVDPVRISSEDLKLLEDLAERARRHRESKWFFEEKEELVWGEENDGYELFKKFVVAYKLDEQYRLFIESQWKELLADEEGET